MTTHVELDDIQTTRGEKLLALVMTVFLLIGGIWAYDRLERGHGYTPPAYTAAEQARIARAEAAQRRVFESRRAVDRERGQLEIAREAYRTAIEAGQPSARLGARYQSENAQFHAAEAELRRAQQASTAAQPAARAAYDRAARAQESLRQRDERNTFLLRFVFVLAALGGSFWTFTRLRRSRYLPLASASVAAATLLAFVLAVDYIGNYVRWQDLGPLVLSAAGVALTLLAFWGLQRYLARRIPRSRVRKGECPFCGYPVRGRGAHCEGCGRDVVAECARCAAERRVGTPFCAACGEV